MKDDEYMKNSDVLVLVITYNPDLDVLDKFDLQGFNYLIVDNSDNTAFDLASHTQSNTNIHYIKNPSNLGIAKALNIGADYALSNGYKWLLTMDQDSQLKLENLKQMLQFIEHYSDVNKLAILSPRHVMQDDLQVKVNNEMAEYSHGIKTMTSGNLLNLSVWQKINGFNSELFIDMVDIDYYCRAIIARYQVLTLNHIYMSHQLGNLRTVNLLGKKLRILNHNYIRKYYQVRNSLTVYFKYRRQIPELGSLTHRFIIIDLLVSLFFESDRFRKFRFMLLGIYHFLIHRLGKLDV